MEDRQLVRKRTIITGKLENPTKILGKFPLQMIYHINKIFEKMKTSELYY